MTPAASVSGLYFGHPSARYFSVGRIGRDQVEDYAERKGDALAEVERCCALTSPTTLTRTARAVMSGRAICRSSWAAASVLACSSTGS